VELQGQLLAGLSVVLTPPEDPVPGLPVLTFPGNLGEADTLRQAWRCMEEQGSAACSGDADQPGSSAPAGPAASREAP
jgi:hypothetical protein